MNQLLPPFSCTYSPNIPELLSQLGCSLAVSTYQAGKVIFLSATTGDRLIQLPRQFQKPMGLAVQGSRLAIATRQEVLVLANDPSLAPAYPSKPGTYDAFYAPRAVYYTGELDLHDMAWGKRGLWAVNTRFSCLSLVDDSYSFRPEWKPPFITGLAAEDRCHLNGMALEDGEPHWATALGASDEREGWRKGLAEGKGVLIDVKSGAIVLEGLYMPHSPRIHEGKLYMLLSGTGELVVADPARGKYEVMAKVKGFARGLAAYGDFLFVGLSRLRLNSSTFKDLPIAKDSLSCGVMVVDRRQGSLVGLIKYENSVEEIYDVQVLPGMRRPGILNHEDGDHRRALSLPGASFWGAREEAPSPEPEKKS